MLLERCRSIRLILSDVDGVLTDGGIVYTNQGIEVKRFHVRDGLGIRLWQKAGYRFGLITLRSSNIVKVRMAELGIDIIRQGTDSKLAAALGRIAQKMLEDAELFAQFGVSEQEIVEFEQRIREFVEIPEDMVFTEEYSVRAARIAVYTLFDIPQKICPVTPYNKAPKVLLNAARTMYR